MSRLLLLRSARSTGWVLVGIALGCSAPRVPPIQGGCPADHHTSMGECIPDARDRSGPATREHALSNWSKPQQLAIPAGAPKLVALNHDDFAAKYVGRTTDGRQFFVTSPFVPASDHAPGGREFLALYVFDARGALLNAVIDDLGPRAELDERAAVRRRGEWLEALGVAAFERIEVAPFRIERFGVEFGLIPQPPEEPGDDWSVIVEPGNYMSFGPPWTSGDYDT